MNNSIVLIDGYDGVDCAEDVWTLSIGIETTV
jgi:hypothetical protein